MEECYPNALLETYKGVSRYIYSAQHVNNSGDNVNISYVVTSREAVEFSSCEYIEDACDEIIKAAASSLIRITRFVEMNDAKRKWITDTMKYEYETAIDHPEYRYFIENKFGIEL